MAKKTVKRRAKRTKAVKPVRKSRPKKVSARKASAKKAAAKKAGPVTAAATAVASTVMDRLRAWSPSRYSPR